MPATFSQIRGWLGKLYEPNPRYTHMVIKCDSFDSGQCCYPVYVKHDEDVTQIAEEGNDRLMEVYSANHGLEEQMSERRAFHYD